MDLWHQQPEVPFGAAVCPDPSLGNLVLGPHRGCLRDPSVPRRLDADLRPEFYRALAPCALAFVLGLSRLWRLRGRPVVTPWSKWASLKLLTWCLLPSLDLLILALSFLRWGPRTLDAGSVAAAVALTVPSGILLAFVSKTEHKRSREPSILLQTFLVFAIVFDAFRVRDLRLVWSHEGAAIASCLKIQLAMKFVLLVAESASKSG